MAVEKLIVDHIDTWTTALQARSTAGRGNPGKIDLYGIKKLRELILELAVRGKLVPQDPNDEPASELLKRIEQEKAQLVKDGKIKKQKPLPPISDKEKPFELPEGWEWVTLATVGEIVGGGTPKSDTPHYWAQNGIKWLTPADLYGLKGKYISSGARDISPAGLSNSSARLMPKGSVLFSSRAPIGYVAIADAELSTNQGFKSCVPYIKESAEYIYYFLLASAKKIDAEASGTTFKEVSGAIVSKILFPLPPLSEQLKIVSRANDLMSLCDQLEQHSLTSLDAHQQLVETLLSTLTDSQNADELAENWARISEHFDTLFTTETSIDALKQTILQLAVMGKLVPQDPNDEPAVELLKRIAQEKAQLVKDGKIKKQKPLPPISDEEKPFELPKGWFLAHFGDIAIEIATGPFGSMIHQSDYIIGGVPLINPLHIVNSKIVIDPAISVSTELAKSLSSYKMVAGNIVMARRGEMGRCAVVTTKENGYLCGTGSFILKFSDEIDKNYIVELFKTVYVRNYLGGNSVGSTMTNLNHSILNKMPIHLPPVRMQSKIVAAITSFSAYCENLKSQIQSAQQTQLHLADTLTDAAIN
ncbi:restriction endonuclease subunit S [Salmonella enterica]|nr:restriction endonuclease subunit S [Salmonella enterica]